MFSAPLEVGWTRRFIPPESSTCSLGHASRTAPWTRTVPRRRAGKPTRRRPPGYLCSSATAASLPHPLRELCERLRQEPDARARLQAVVQLGDTQLPVLPTDRQTESTRVRGCVSVTHLRVECDGDERVQAIRGASDARVAAGLLTLLALGLVEATAAQVAALRPEWVLEAAGLTGAVSPSRSQGLAAMMAHIRAQLRSKTLPGTLATAHDNTRPTERRPTLPFTAVQAPEVAVLLSGGVDSSVALGLLLEQGYRPRPFYLKIWLEDEVAHLGQCPWEEDLQYATAVCETLSRRYGIALSLEAVPLQRQYWERVVQYTVEEARQGRTPNPDMMCNQRVKFGAFVEYATPHSGYVATGHYARKATAAAESDRDQSSRSRLLRSPDPVKDQTYFLSQLSQAQLQRAVFPIGHLRKDEVRQLAESHFDLPNQRRRDSQGICFLGKLRFDDFLLHYLGERHGKIVDVDAGRVVGTHRGFWFYTVGQRRGLRMSDGPWYVVGKNIDDNIVYVSRLEPQAEAPQSHFRVATLNWIAGEPPSPSWLAGGTLDVKIRHGPHLHRGRLRLDGDGNASPTGVVELERHEVGLAPGQFAVFYHGDECLGGGVIADMGRAVYR
ncbi:hypothetical protein CDCA_CDCA02G0536 [Cyanidium caldarium]|uniref:tRNA-5-taurinomethyluridine 2-sulfurtransferase n=1 Tax=Cyanidium caldarium TaxID=2771 RepID=A0AAV9IR13_CYACA|nr:hypothetical protein CDCA_CDCA02G0536 [Cyanidium caldarium]